METDVVIAAADTLIFPPLIEELQAAHAAAILPGDEAERARFLAEHGDMFRVAVTASASGVSRDLMESMPNLEAIANFGVGYDSTDVDAARERGIGVANTPDVLNDCVADLAVGLLIDVMRAVSASDRYARTGRWPQGAYPLQHRVTGKRVGILGLGRIGEAIAQRLQGFRCEIAYHNRHRLDSSPYRYLEDARALAQWADVLVVATPGGAQTRALVNADVLAGLGAHGYLVNISRGSVVDEDALVHAVRDGIIAGAGLDVFAHEPHIPDGLRDLDNVVITPHVASATLETRRAMADVVSANVESWLTQRRLVTPV